MSDIIFKRLDEHNEKIVQLRIEQGIQSARISNIEKQHADICEQLIATRTEVLTSIQNIATKQEKIIVEQNKTEGARSAVKAFPLVLGALVVILQIWQLLGKH